MSYNWGAHSVDEVKTVKTLAKLPPINVAKLKGIGTGRGGKIVYKHKELSEIMRSLSITTGRGEETVDSLYRLFTVEDNPGSFSFMPLYKEVKYDYL